MAVSVIFVMLSSIRVWFAHRREDGVEPAVPLLSPEPVALDPGVHQVEDAFFEQVAGPFGVLVEQPHGGVRVPRVP
jgi:hypothetical protein